MGHVVVHALFRSYIRHVCDPKELWGWLQPFVEDGEEFSELGDSSKTTLGRFVCKLLVEPEYHDEIKLPRIPVPVHRDIQEKLAARGLARAPVRPGGAGDRGRYGEGSSSGGGHGRDPRDYRDNRDPRDYRDNRDQRDYRDSRDPRDDREWDQGKRRAVGGPSASKAEKRKCDFCHRFSCIC